MRIPNRLNLVLVVLVHAALLALFWSASRLAWPYAIPIGIAASFLFLTNYALLHEACHAGLNASPRMNQALGTACGALFPVSFTFLKVAHRVHHDNNRTDYEMFDYYYPDDNLWVKRAQWYSILIGIYPPIIPLGSVLMGFAPRFFAWRPFAAARSSYVLFANNQYQRGDIRVIRMEAILGIGYWVLLWKGLSLSALPMLIVYLCCWFNWSTRQYVTHAFTPRDVLAGALNLRTGRLFSHILLRGEWDQVHHLHPDVSWKYLPEYADRTMKPVSYMRQYLSLWKGPRPNPDPAPSPLNRAPRPSQGLPPAPSLADAYSRRAAA
jgi:fatty acid desaturase